MPHLQESRTEQLKVLENLEKEIQKALAMNVDTTTRLMLRTYDEKLNSLVRDMQGIHDAYFMGGPANYSTFKAKNIERRIQQFIQRDIAMLDAEVNRIISQALEKQFETSMYRWAWALDQTTPPNIIPTFGMPPELLLRQALSVTWRGNMFSQEISVINDDAATRLQSAFNDAMINGDSAYEMGRRIRGEVGIDADERLVTRPLAGRAKWRADMISRTELMRSANLAQEYLYKQNRKIVDDRVWVTRPANQFLRGKRRLCEFCEERRDLPEDEVKVIAKAQGLPLMPPIHPHCSCVWALVPKPWSELMDKDMAQKLKFADEGNKNIMDFPAWQKQFAP